jgi:hypothetical protein
VRPQVAQCDSGNRLFGIVRGRGVCFHMRMHRLRGYCKELDSNEIKPILESVHGNIAECAAILGISSLRLRAYVQAKPELRAILAECREQLADKAEDVVREALYDPHDAYRRDRMAMFVLNSALGKTPGYGTGAKNTAEIRPRGAMVVSWMAEEPARDEIGMRFRGNQPVFSVVSSDNPLAPRVLASS